MKKTKIAPTQILATGFLILLLLFAVAPGLFTAYDPLGLNLSNKLAGLSARHLLGTDEYGRDILCRIIYGTRTSILVGFGTATAALILGVPLGLIAGYYGGLADSIIMRVMDAFQSFPSMLLAILMMTVFAPSVFTLIITITLVSFPRFTRLVRSSTLTIKKLEYVTAARSFGADDSYIMFRCILPNCTGNIITQFSLLMSTAILIEASLSFLGFGIQPPDPTWGSMLSYAKRFADRSLSYILGPTMTIFFTVMSINTIGSMVENLFDPTKKNR